MYFYPTTRTNILNNVCGKSSSIGIGSYESCYLGLLTTVPTDDQGTGLVEVSFTSTNYARLEIHDKMSVTYKSYALGEASSTTHDDRIGNAVDLNFNTATDPDDPTVTTGWDWGTIVGWALFTSATGSTPYAWGELDSSVTVSTGDDFHFYAGRFEIYIDDAGNIIANAS